jgi:hypothetical protein
MSHAPSHAPSHPSPAIGRRLGAAAVVTLGFAISFGLLAAFHSHDGARLARLAAPLSVSLFGLSYFLIPRRAG